MFSESRKKTWLVCWGGGHLFRQGINDRWRGGGAGLKLRVIQPLRNQAEIHIEVLEHKVCALWGFLADRRHPVPELDQKSISHFLCNTGKNGEGT